ncbi:MAG: hypothetical protein ACHQ49_01825 [Elusimicrobiota bacterium]
MSASKPSFAEADVVLTLAIDVSPEKRGLLLDFCRRAFPVYESVGGCAMALYEDASRPGRFNEVGYYLTMEDYRRGEDAIRNDPEQARLIAEWRSLLSAPPDVSVHRKLAV